ncbi:hypothetical protein [Kordiimonas marina]|uniref:hypothetical protein n=1 Tax=Kordiimonas marina TaxID=2872312 RepID=UPI001FF5342F|nr:hypothetical protein [Kordiimonas marina]MCJ9428686.1 hypothetical protein [Kordiimonas marina]
MQLASDCLAGAVLGAAGIIPATRQAAESLVLVEAVSGPVTAQTASGLAASRRGAAAAATRTVQAGPTAVNIVYPAK